MVKIDEPLDIEYLKKLDKLIEERRSSGMSYNEMLDVIASEGLDVGVDFKMNIKAGGPGSVRLFQENGKTVLMEIGDRGIQRQDEFDNPEQAYFQTVNLLRGIKQVEEMNTDSFNRHI